MSLCIIFDKLAFNANLLITTKIFSLHLKSLKNCSWFNLIVYKETIFAFWQSKTATKLHLYVKYQLLCKYIYILLFRSLGLVWLWNSFHVSHAH